MTQENQAANIDAEMAASTTLLQFLLMLVAGWLQRQQAATIDYLKAENRMLRERLGGRRIIFTVAERRQLAEKARALGRMALRELGTIVTPETLLRWHRELVAHKWSFVERRLPGRPRSREELAALVVRMARENRSWGYTRIQGAMANLGHQLGRGTIRSILKDHGIEPAPERGKGMPWSVFLKAHWKALAASDFFTVEAWSWSGLVTYYVLFVMELATRRVCIAGITKHPDTEWMLQMARRLTDTVDGILLGKRYLILDRDTKYCQAFRDFVKREGIEVIRLPPRSPNLNAYAERWVRGVRDECLSRLIPIGQGMLRRALREYGVHYHQERNHQGLGNVLIMPRASSAHREGPLVAVLGLVACSITMTELPHSSRQSFRTSRHPFVERLIGTVRREYLDQVLFWNGADLQRKLDEFKDYYNRHRVHSSLKGKTPCEQSGHPCPRQADLRHFMWRSHCGGLFQLPVAA